MAETKRKSMFLLYFKYNCSLIVTMDNLAIFMTNLPYDLPSFYFLCLIEIKITKKLELLVYFLNLHKFSSIIFKCVILPCIYYLWNSFRMALFGITREYLWVLLPLTGYYIGKVLDDLETERMTRFRDKSALYGRILAPGEKPSWPWNIIAII